MKYFTKKKKNFCNKLKWRNQRYLYLPLKIIVINKKLTDILTKDINKNQITNFANKFFNNTLFKKEILENQYFSFKFLINI